MSENLEELLALKEAELALKRGLPFLHGFKHYQWSRDFFESREKLAFLCAANQIGKSTVQIRRMIHWATDKSLWPELWPQYQEPNQYWYIYPTAPQATIEFEKKWKIYLPQGEYKNHPEYGWKEEYKKAEIHAIHFNSGVSIYFKSYKQGLVALQTGTVYYIGLDEECPEVLWDELVMRKQAVDGYISMVFTATLGQEMWRKAIEPKDAEEELFPEAWKRQVAMYDCQYFEDGTTARWTDKRILQVISSCKSTAEVQRRVFGKFVKDSGLKYPQFDVARHMKEWHPIPPTWVWYAGIDIGAGGSDTEAHPSAICFVAVRPDYQSARVVSTWRGDGIRTTASDVYQKYCEMEAELGVKPIGKFYDWASVEFGEIAIRKGAGFQRADKSHDRGETVINVLFRNDMLFIYERGENGKLAGELASVTVDGPKRKKKDDVADALRYCVTSIPWDWSIVGNMPEISTEPGRPKEQTPAEAMAKEIEARRKAFEDETREGEEALFEEFAEVNDLSGS